MDFDIDKLLEDIEEFKYQLENITSLEPLREALNMAEDVTDEEILAEAVKVILKFNKMKGVLTNE